MKSCYFVMFLAFILILSGCASLYQAEITRNAVESGVVGAFAGAGIAAATGGNAGRGALWGSLAGAVLEITSTFPPYTVTPYYNNCGYSYYPPRPAMCYENYQIYNFYGCWTEPRRAHCW